jgi:hypothetical protein
MADLSELLDDAPLAGVHGVRRQFSPSMGALIVDRDDLQDAMAAVKRVCQANDRGPLRTCSGSCCPCGRCRTIFWARLAPGSTGCCPPPTPWTQGPRRAAVDGGGDRQQKMWATTRWALSASQRLEPLLAEVGGSLPARRVPAGHGVALGHRRRLRRRLAGASVSLEELRPQRLAEPFISGSCSLQGLRACRGRSVPRIGAAR